MQTELDLPPREKPTRKSFPTSPRTVRKWRDDIGKQEVREATRRFSEGLHTLNRLAIGPRRRLRIMELLRPMGREILDHLAGRIQAQTLPLPERTRKVFELNLDLLAEIATGYAIVLADSAATAPRRRIAIAAERALAARGETMLRCAQVYAPLDERFWHNVHTMYACAEAAGAADRPVRDDTLVRAPRRRETPRQAYTRLLMLALAHTQGLRKGEAERIHAAIETWCRLAEFGTPAAARHDGGASDTLFAVDLAGAAPPEPWREVSAGDMQTIRTLELHDVVARVEALQSASPGTETPVPEPDRVGLQTLVRLAGSWRQRTVERSERAQRQASVDVEVTLPAIQARLVAEERPREPARGPGPRPEPGPTKSEAGPERGGASLALQTIERDDGRRTDYVTHPGHDGMEQSGDNWEAVSRGRAFSPGYVQARAAEEARQVEAVHPDRPEWHLEDVSQTGFRLRWKGEGASRAIVGELVALRASGPQAKTLKWRVGVIRWMQFVDETCFEVGVHALSGNIGSAQVRREPANRNRRRKREQEPTEPALLLPGLRREKRAATVLLPAHMFQRGEIVELDVRDRMLRVKLGTLRENTGSFAQFEIVPAPRRGRNAAGGASADGGDAPVWNSL